DKDGSKVLVLGVVGGNTLLKGVAGVGGGLFRSTDDGTNWTKVADCEFNRVGHVVMFHGVAYLTTATGVMISQDKGEHWALPGEECRGLRGPVMFGKDAQHKVVYGEKGFWESKNGGKSWSLAVSFGEDTSLRQGRYEYGIWNPHEDTFYLTHIAGKAF